MKKIDLNVFISLCEKKTTLFFNSQIKLYSLFKYLDKLSFSCSKKQFLTNCNMTKKKMFSAEDVKGKEWMTGLF